VSNPTVTDQPRDGHRIDTAWVDVPVGQHASSTAATMSAYLAQPAERGRWPVVLVGFEMFGVTGYVRSIADRLATAGYVAMVPDFYHRHDSGSGSHVELSANAEGRTRGLELVAALRRDEVREDVQGALDYLALHPAGNGTTAMLGLSAGGHIAYYVASQVPLSALVVFYPGWLTGTDIALSRPEPTLALTPRIAQLGTPVLFLVGEDDHLFTAGQRDEIADQMDRAGLRHEMVVYPDTPHGFFCDERDTYRADAAVDAWDRVLRLLAASAGLRR